MDTKQSSDGDDNDASCLQIYADKLSNQITSSNSIRLGPVRRNPATFLDLPGELRNVVYPDVLRYQNERRLRLKVKTTANGGSYVKEQTPPLCYAVPSLWKEVLSIYYSENRFRIPVISSAQRCAFRKWAVHRGQMLKSLKQLKMGLQVPRYEPWQSGSRRESKKDVSIVLQLIVDPDGELILRYGSKTFNWCGCWLLRLVEEELREVNGNVTGADYRIKDKGGQDASEINPIIDFALKFCRILESKGTGYNWQELCDAGSCACYGERAHT